MRKQTYLENERTFAIYLYNKVRKSNVNLQLGWGEFLSNDEILKEYDTDVQFKEFVDTQYILKKEKEKLRKRIAYLKVIENNDANSNNFKRAQTMGPEALSASANKSNETLGPIGRSARSKKAHENLGPEGRSARSKKGRETLGADGCSLASKKRAVTMGKEKLSASTKKGRETIGKEKLSEISTKGANFICEWSNGELTKGALATSKLKNIVGIEIINRVNIVDLNWNDFLKKWNDQQSLKQIKKKEESLSPSESQQTICEWSDKSLTKGSRAISKKLKEGLLIFKKITVRDTQYLEYNSKWEKTYSFDRKGWLKSKNKGTKSNAFKVICPDGYPTTAASATVYCRNRGLDRSKCVPVN